MTEELDERTPLVRVFPVELEAAGDGRTIDMRIVPYNTPTMVADSGDRVPYRESWLPGVFDKQMKAMNRVKVLLNFEHEQGIRGVIGHGVDLADHDDGAYGSFRVHENTDGDKALQLVREGLLGGVSLEAIPLKSQRVNGVVERVRAHLDRVALCRTGLAAYEKAEVLAVRTGPVETETEVELSPELTARLAAIGVEAMVKRVVVRTPWNGAASRFTDEEYQRSCLIDKGGDMPVKERCALPVLEPNGDLNVNALGAAAARLSQVQAGRMMKSAAARKLVRYYRQAQMTPPASVVSLAAS